jgi:hypothetical protein
MERRKVFFAYLLDWLRTQKLDTRRECKGFNKFFKFFALRTITNNLELYLFFSLIFPEKLEEGLEENVDSL